MEHLLAARSRLAPPLDTAPQYTAVGEDRVAALAQPLRRALAAVEVLGRVDSVVAAVAEASPAAAAAVASSVCLP